MQAIRPTETSIITRATRRHFLEYGILHSHLHEKLVFYNRLKFCCEVVSYSLRPGITPGRFLELGPVSGRTDRRNLMPEEGLGKLKQTCKISGFLGGDYEEWCILGYYTEWLL
jgi:hypothetical protein